MVEEREPTFVDQSNNTGAGVCLTEEKAKYERHSAAFRLKVVS
jgi:hypothetical protein